MATLSWSEKWNAADWLVGIGLSSIYSLTSIVVSVSACAHTFLYIGTNKNEMIFSCYKNEIVQLVAFISIAKKLGMPCKKTIGTILNSYIVF